MDATGRDRGKSRKGKKAGNSGFSLIEVVISISILMIALLALVRSFAAAVGATASAQEDLIAKQKAMQAVESTHRAPNAQQCGFAAINTLNAGGGIFLLGSQPLLSAGADGLVGTSDD